MRLDPDWQENLLRVLTFRCKKKKKVGGVSKEEPDDQAAKTHVIEFGHHGSANMVPKRLVVKRVSIRERSHERKV